MQQPLKCPTCGAEFATQQALNEHVQKEHIGTQLGPPEQEDPAASPEFPGDDTIKKSGGYEAEVPAERR
jgi:hypothetical protein